MFYVRWGHIWHKSPNGEADANIHRMGDSHGVYVRSKLLSTRIR